MDRSLLLFARKVFVLVLLVSTVSTLSAQRKKVGLVLSGGGAKGVAHIGVLKVLEEAGIPVDVIAGTSMGAIVGGLYSIGYSSKSLDSLVRSQDWTFLLSDKVFRYDLPFSEKEITEKYLISVPIRKRSLAMPSGFISGQNIYNLFLDLTIGYHDSIHFSQLPIPFACVASNLVNGKEVVLDGGNLALAMRSSMAIPGAFAPIIMEDMVLVDGGISNNFPTDLAKAMGADIIIGVDVQSDLKDEKGLESVMGIVDQLTSFLGMEKYEENKKITDLYIKPDINPYSAASFSKDAIDTLINRGELMARSQWDELLALKEKIGILESRSSVKQTNTYLSDKDTIRINQILMEGCDKRDEKWLRSMIRIKNYSRVTMSEIRKAISELYGTGAFSRVSFRLSGGPRFDLIFTMESKPSNTLNLGFRFDSEEMAAILINTRFNHKSMRGSTISLTGRLSTNPYVRLDYSLGNTFLRRFNLSYTFKYNDIGIYSKGDKTDNVSYRYHQGDLGLSNLSFKNFRLQLGLRYEYFDYEAFLYSDREESISVKPEGLFSYYFKAQMETFDKRYYPERGFSFNANLSVYTDDLVSYKDESPFAAVGFSYESVIGLSRRVKLLPSVYGRILIGDKLTYPVLNCIGGTVGGRYVSQQLPFTGVQNLELVDNSVVVAKLQLRYRLGSRHYLNFIGNYLRQDDSFFDILKGGEMWGGSIGYSYNSIIGPIDFILNYSNWTKNPGFFFNLGYYF